MRSQLGVAARARRTLAVVLVVALASVGVGASAHAAGTPPPAVFDLPGTYVQQGQSSNTVGGVALGDFDGADGVDLVTAVTNEGLVQVFDNDGTGTFDTTPAHSLATTSPVSFGVTSVATGDVNGDGDVDIVTGNQGPHKMTILFNDGVGGFGAPVEYALPASNEVFVTLGDLDGLNGLDIVVGNKYGADASHNKLSVFLNQGAGVFPGTPTSVASGGNGIQYVTLGDVDGVNGLDIVVANRDSNNVAVIPNNGNGTFNEGGTTIIATDDSPLSVAVGDLGNGNADLVVGTLAGVANVFMNDGAGVLSPGTDVGIPWHPTTADIADFNLDGINDIVFPTNPDGVYGNALALGNGPGTFEAATTIPFSQGTGGDPAFSAVGDLNDDSKPDLVTGTGSSNGDVRTLLNETIAAVVPTISGVSVSGIARVGNTLTANPGTVGGTPTPGVAYQWKSATSANGTYSAIGGATSRTYTVSSANVGKYLKVAATATNSAGSASALSTATSKVAKAAQTARRGCVIEPRQIPRRGVRRLLKAHCRTNAGQRVAVTVSAVRSRGDVSYFQLYCQTSPQGGMSKTVPLSYGQVCLRGQMLIRTLGTSLRLGITWAAPARSGYAAFRKYRTYQT